MIFAKSRGELVAATKALDRVLLWNHYVVPQFTYDKVRAARWDRFGRPDELPKYGAAAIPNRLVVGRPEGRKGRDTPMKYSASDLTRRGTLALGAGALASMVARPGSANEGPERHGISAFGDLKYPADFKHFDYVNLDAPKGGMFSHIGSVRAFNQNFLTFNTLNSYILKGDAAQGMELTFATLMARALDEPDSSMGSPPARCASRTTG